jgi:hypothetical protein
MRSIKHTLLLVLAAILLVSGSGVFVMIHTCLSAKKTEYSFSPEHKCCKKKDKSHRDRASIEKKCCTIQYYYHKLKIDTTERKFQDLIVALVSPVIFSPVHFFIPSNEIICFGNSDPPLAKSELFIAFRQLLI